MTERRYRILLIEDDRIAQMAFKRFVAEETIPYDYTIASSVSEANSIIAAAEFDAVIVDYLLGDGTAFDVFDSLMDTPIIFATGAGNEELAVKAMKAGAYDYLIKDPTRNYLSVLPEIIKHAIEHKKVEEELRGYHERLEELVKERTEQLTAEKELLSVTFASMADGVIMVDTDKHIILMNPVAQNLTGLTIEQVRGRPIDEVFRLVDNRSGKNIPSPVNEVLSCAAGETKTSCGTLVSKSGAERPVAVTAAPVHKDVSAVTGVVMILRDLTQEQEVERIKTDFISSVSHELRTPLTSIKAYTATILRDRSMLDKTKYDFLAVIREEAERLTSLVNELLEVSELDAGPAKILRQAVEVVAVVRQVFTALKPLAEDKHIQLEARVCDKMPTLLADTTKIQSVISNLVNNAIKFTPAYGKVSISVQSQGQELVIRVSDTGIGMPKEELPRIFERFYRIRKPGEQTPGTGLGLAIVKEVAALYGGRVGVESEPGRGTTFTVVLPTAQEPHCEAVAAGHTQ